MRRRPSAGFTLIEITAAMLLFFLIVTSALWMTSDAVDQSLAAERSRRLSMLADLRLGEIAVFERHHDEPYGPEDFRDLPEGLREDFEGWKWETAIEDFTFFGQQKDPNAPYFFQDDAAEEADTLGTETSGTGGAGGEAAAKKGEAQILRRIVLKVSSPEDDGGPADAIEIVTFLPQVARPPATTGGTGGPGSGR